MGKDNTHYGVKEKILHLEKLFDVDKWIVNNIHVWPYIRIKLFFLLLTNSNSEGSISNNFQKSHHAHKKNTFFYRLQQVFRVFKSFIKNELFFIQLKKKKIVFFGSHIHRVLHGKVHFNRFFDSMTALHNLHESVYMVEHQKVYHTNYNEKAIIRLESHLQDYKRVQKVKSKFKKVHAQQDLKDYDQFLKLISQEIHNASSLNISHSNLDSWTKKIQNIEAFYNRFFIKVNPEKIIFPGYYAWDNLYAAVLAANKLQIKTIDFQHGYQTNGHMVFTNWTKIPVDGYGIMPTEYWTWDEKSKKDTEEWTRKTKKIKVKVVGQPYLEFWKNQNKEIIQKEKIILYSLQLMPLKQTFDNSIIQLIKNSKHTWQIRLHPRNEFTREDIQNLLHLAGVNESSYEIHDSRMFPLPEVLSRTFLHVTAFSGCLIEAKMMGIPTILINNVGREIYKDYIDNNLVFYLDSQKDNFLKAFLELHDSLIDNKYESDIHSIANPIFI